MPENYDRKYQNLSYFLSEHYEIFCYKVIDSVKFSTKEEIIC